MKLDILHVDYSCACVVCHCVSVPDSSLRIRCVKVDRSTASRGQNRISGKDGLNFFCFVVQNITPDAPWLSIKRCRIFRMVRDSQQIDRCMSRQKGNIRIAFEYRNKLFLNSPAGCIPDMQNSPARMAAFLSIIQGIRGILHERDVQFVDQYAVDHFIPFCRKNFYSLRIVYSIPCLDDVFLQKLWTIVRSQ